MPSPPIIGITADADDARHLLSRTFTAVVEAAGGVPVILPAVRSGIPSYLAICDGVILSSGDDPDTTQWGIPLHPAAKPIDAARQAFEWALLDRLRTPVSARRTRPIPVLGVCLGMQMMAIHAGGTLDQHLADHLPTADRHWGKKPHQVVGALGDGIVESHHRQAITDPGGLTVVATAPDGVIEAVRDDDHPFFLGVQWHPERTEDPALGVDIVRRFVAAARTRSVAV